jgi:hypothetical protein
VSLYVINHSCSGTDEFCTSSTGSSTRRVIAGCPSGQVASDGCSLSVRRARIKRSPSHGISRRPSRIRAGIDNPILAIMTNETYPASSPQAMWPHVDPTRADCVLNRGLAVVRDTHQHRKAMRTAGKQTLGQERPVERTVLHVDDDEVSRCLRQYLVGGGISQPGEEAHQGRACPPSFPKACVAHVLRPTILLPCDRMPAQFKSLRRGRLSISATVSNRLRTSPQPTRIISIAGS